MSLGLNVLVAALLTLASWATAVVGGVGEPQAEPSGHHEVLVWHQVVGLHGGQQERSTIAARRPDVHPVVPPQFG